MATENTFQDPNMWVIVVNAAREHLGSDAVIPELGPNRHQYRYFTQRLEPHLDAYVQAQR